MKERLILFDIDGTLVLDDGAARGAFAWALREAYGFAEPIRGYDFSGKTDPEIATTILRDHGMGDDEINGGLRRLWDAYLEKLALYVCRERVRVLDGVTELLSILERESATLALLTGNIEPGARIKLGSHGLNRYFPFGAFGSDSMHRQELPPIALRRAAEHHGRPFAMENVVIIGDSIHDVRCGVPHGAITIAVASGRTPAETLQAERPDFLFHSLEPTEELLDAVLRWQRAVD
ncbi:MAG: HAD family hydrolase [Thermoanaerobaculia bacterium]